MFCRDANRSVPTAEEKVDFGRMHPASSVSHSSLKGQILFQIHPKSDIVVELRFVLLLRPAIPQVSPSLESSWEGLASSQEGLDPCGRASSNHASTAGRTFPFLSHVSCFSSSFTFPWHSQPCPLAAPWSLALHPHLARAELSLCPTALGLGF